MRVAVIGEHHPGHEPQDAIAPALEHAAAAVGAACEAVWIDTPTVAHHASAVLGGFDAVWCAPGSPYLSLEGALEASAGPANRARRSSARVRGCSTR